MTEAAQKIEAREPGFEWIPPDKLSPSKTNPRKRFDGPEMDELTASVKVHGVLQPLVVRPNGEGFEIVAGERRFRAAKAAGLEVVPCMVRALTDEDVLEIQIIENLQRQDLNPLEEARGFKVILDQGRLEVADLAEKINVSAQYIGRRVAVLELPEVMLKAWGKGEFQFGHLVQLARVRDDKTRNELAKEVLRYGQSVGDLRRRVAALSPHLDKAPFKTAECNTCSANSQVQKTLLAPEDLAEQQKGRHCLNPKCYRKKLLAWIKENENKLIGRSGARSVRLDEGFSWENKHAFHRAESAPK
ncbi:MAG: ParB/RepB/Spo0J family partition protein, partial [Proteobacteria bacterium]|nr:ParB/RepB/Spo0J family partition protein [Pseudomonadota bacterium]